MNASDVIVTQPSEAPGRVPVLALQPSSNLMFAVGHKLQCLQQFKSYYWASSQCYMCTIFTVARILYRIERARLDYMQSGDWLFKFHTTHVTYHSYDSMVPYNFMSGFFFKLKFILCPYAALVKKHTHQTYKVHKQLKFLRTHQQ